MMRKVMTKILGRGTINISLSVWAVPDPPTPCPPPPWAGRPVALRTAPEELALGSPQGTGEELILLAAAVTTAFESSGAGAGGAKRRRWSQGGRKIPASPELTHFLGPKPRPSSGAQREDTWRRDPGSGF